MSDDSHCVLIFGDSHCVIFVGAEGTFKASVNGHDSASISGLDNPNSKLEYGKYILELIKGRPKTYQVLLKLGQVDLEFVMYHKIYNKKEIFTFDEFCSSLIRKYKQFIQEILTINPHVVIASINLPSYCDSMNPKQYILRTINNGLVVADSESDPDGIEDHKLLNFSLQQLTENFQSFNHLLKDLAEELNLRFFDMNELFIDPQTGFLKEQYRDSGHHYKGYNDETLSNAKLIAHEFFNTFFEKGES